VNNIFPSQDRGEAKYPSIFFVESSHQLRDLCLQHNGFELTCGGMPDWFGSASARPLLIYPWCYSLRAAKPTRKCFRQVERIVSQRQERFTILWIQYSM
jgi:hypothetical protein